MPRKHYKLGTHNDDPTVRPLDLAYPGFLSRRDMECLAKCTIELKEVAVERPKYIGIALDENLKYLLRTITNARHHQEELNRLYAEIADEVWKYGHIFHRIQSTIKGDSGIASSICGWAQWTDGTVYEIDKPEVRITPIILNWAQMIKSVRDGGYNMVVDHQNGSTVAIPWQSSLSLTERMMYDTNIIVITTGTITGDHRDEAHIERVNQSYKDSLIHLIGALHNGRDEPRPQETDEPGHMTQSPLEVASITEPDAPNYQSALRDGPSSKPKKTQGE